MRPLHSTIFHALVFTLCSAAAYTAGAQSWPSKPIRLVLQFAPGGGADVVARPLAPLLADALGQPIVIENKPGANGEVANQLVNNAPNDGYTLLFGASGPMVIAPHLSKLTVDPAKAFVPVALVSISPFAVVVPPSLGPKTLQELTALAKAKPGALNFGSSGNGGSTHLAGELYKSMANVDIVHVPFTGMGPALTAIVGGHLQISFPNVGTILGLAKDGKVRVLAVTSAERSSALPEVPTMIESGVPGYNVSTWYGIYVPVGTPTEVVEKVNAAVNKALGNPQMRERLQKEGSEAGKGTAAEFAAFAKEDYDRWGDAIRKAKIKVE